MKSSSLPIITSTYFASSRFTSCAFAWPPIALPQRVAVVQIVRDDRAVLLARPAIASFATSGVVSDKRAKYAAGVKPARTFVAKDLFPVDVARLELRNGRVAAVGASERRAHAEAAFGKVQTVADCAADAVVLHPLNVRLIHTALVDQILDKPTDRIVGKCCHDGGIQTEASLQSARDVVFAAAFPNLERARRVNAPLARIEPQHHLAKADDVPFTVIFWFYFSIPFAENYSFSG